MESSARSATTDRSVIEYPCISRRGRLRGSPEPIAALNRVRILEYAIPFVNREPLVDVRTYCPHLQLSEHLCPFLRRTAADMLNAAQSSLPTGFRFQVGTCLRTLSMQKHGWDNYHNKMRELHPAWPISTLRRAVNKYFAPYDQPAPPGHCTGGAVDVGLLGPDGEPVDVLGPTKGWEAAYTWSDKIGDAARANRMLMVDAMLNAGFSNCRDEYWHYSWGDSAWAVRTGQHECPFGWCHPPVALDTVVDEGSAIIESVHTVRDQDGRPVRAEAAVRPVALDAVAASTRIRFRINWANGVPLTVRVHGLIGTGSSHQGTFHFRTGDEVWEGIAEQCSEGDTTVLQLTPTTDRVVISNFVSKLEDCVKAEAR